MPELPEVETIRLTLKPYLLGKTITGGEISLPKLIQNQTSDQFLAQVSHRKILGLLRRGKYLLVNLAGDLTVAFHLRMTGQLVVAKTTDPTVKSTYLRLILDDGTELRFIDQRKFGKILLYPSKSLPLAISKLGPEPLEPEFSVAVLKERLSHRKLAIKKALLNQEIIVGLGNIYTDEALFLSGIHPARTVESLTEQELEKLYLAIKQVLTEGIKYRGTTTRDYCDGEGKPGSYQERLNVYGRKGLPCPICKAPIAKMNFGGRGTHFCPLCQS
jgi:formamidopyrimidine-DNA glycosylase